MNSKSLIVPDDLRDMIGAPHRWQVVTTGESSAQVYRVRVGDAPHYLKLSAHTDPASVVAERDRLQWLVGRVPVPQVIYAGASVTHHFLLMSAIEGLHPFHDDLAWSPHERIAVLARAVRRFHCLPVAECPYVWDVPPAPASAVVVHGDLFPVNMLVHPDTQALNAYIDVGRVGVGDAYTDLARCCLAIDWHYGTAYIPAFFEQYGAPLDRDRLRFHQARWRLR